MYEQLSWMNHGDIEKVERVVFWGLPIKFFMFIFHVDIEECRLWKMCTTLAKHSGSNSLSEKETLIKIVLIDCVCVCMREAERGPE